MFIWMQMIDYISIVDDDPITIFGIRKMLALTIECKKIDTHVNGKIALEAILEKMEKKEPLPQIIFLDLNMPIMDGWEFLEIIEALNVKLPTVILTAIRRDNASLCSVMTSYDNVLSIENKPLDIKNVGRILDMLKEANTVDGS